MVVIAYVGPPLSGCATSMAYVCKKLRGTSEYYRVDAQVGSRAVSLRAVSMVAWRERPFDDLIGSADVVVFVVDSQRERLEADLHAADLIDDAFTRTGRKPVVLLNKQDLPNVLPRAELTRLLNRWQAPEVATIATRGKGVMEAFELALASTSRKTA
jgi:hypothetical protein